MDTFTDPRDGKTYKTVTIGKQTWMAENLNYDAPGSKSYENNPANAQKYGRLYDWETAKKACPPGWHLPSDAEWQELVNFAGGEAIAGEKLKATSGWDSFNGQSGNGTDEYGFAALPGGGGHVLDGSFDFVGRVCGWWSTTATEYNQHYYRAMGRDNTKASRQPGSKTILRSVRCVKD